MKKRMIGAVLLVCLLALAGCAAAEQETDSTNAPAAQSDTAAVVDPETATTVQEDTETTAQEEQKTQSNTLVIYFSRTGEQYNVGVIDKGNTAIVADMIAEQSGADAFEILPADDRYPMTYDELTDVAKQEQNENARPAIAGEIPDLTEYDTIFIGAPVWWGDWPMIMYTFFEENEGNLAGKTLIPFSTHAGSGLSGFDRKLAEACPESDVGTGLAVAGTDAQNDSDSVRENVTNWLAELGY